MRFMGRGVILSLIVAVPAAAWGAAQPSALAQVAGGLWEISGVPGSSEAIRECVPNVALLAQFEHRGRNCSRNILSDKGSSTLISYKCGAAGFGQSTVEVLTPRSLQISTQGISDQLPFNYVLQAHRVGECTKSPTVTHH
jgi:hypothetical protein